MVPIFNNFIINNGGKRTQANPCVYRVSKKFRTGEISRKLSISEKNVSYKSCRISNDLFTDLFSLILGDVIKVKSH